MPDTYINSNFASESIQNYLKAIYQLGYGGRGAAGQEIAGVMKVSAPGVTKMLHHLAAHKLIVYKPYQPVFLTELGEKVALEVIRHHRLLELYLMQSLGYGWEHVHAEAERLEHHISEEFESTIEKLLGFPEFDPHGDPIPTRDGKMPPVTTKTLLSQPTGTKFIIRRVVDEDPNLLIYLADRNLRPGTVATVEEREPFNGSLQLLVAGRRERVSPDAAKHVFVDIFDLVESLTV
jgi:DtxR family transcriptional regulator, Mn-dependent transcriptional regulator